MDLIARLQLEAELFAFFAMRGASRMESLNPFVSSFSHGLPFLSTVTSSTSFTWFPMNPLFLASFLWNHHEEEEDTFIEFLDSMLRLYEPRGPPPATASAIESLAKVSVDKVFLDGHPRCTICFDDFEIGTTTVGLPCKHYYHEQCIQTWLKQHNTCPVCRYELECDDPQLEEERKSRMSVRGQTIQSRSVQIDCEVSETVNIELNPIDDAHTETTRGKKRTRSEIARDDEDEDEDEDEEQIQDDRPDTDCSRPCKKRRTNMCSFAGMKKGFLNQ